MQIPAVDFLLNPDIAYLILVAAALATMMAVLNPGTGVMEVFALFMWIISGYIVYNMPINYWALGILLVGVVLFLLALRKMKTNVYLVLAIAAVVVGSAFLFDQDQPGLQPAVNPILAVIVSIIVAGFVWVVAQKALEADQMRPAHDLEALIGTIGEAKTPINDEGSVQVEGELWSAKSDQEIPEGSPVRVVGREGFRLKVEIVED